MTQISHIQSTFGASSIFYNEIVLHIISNLVYTYSMNQMKGISIFITTKKVFELQDIGWYFFSWTMLSLHYTPACHSLDIPPCYIRYIYVGHCYIIKDTSLSLMSSLPEDGSQPLICTDINVHLYSYIEPSAYNISWYLCFSWLAQF